LPIIYISRFIKFSREMKLRKFALAYLSEPKNLQFLNCKVLPQGLGPVTQVVCRPGWWRHLRNCDVIIMTHESRISSPFHNCTESLIYLLTSNLFWYLFDLLSDLIWPLVKMGGVHPVDSLGEKISRKGSRKSMWPTSLLQTKKAGWPGIFFQLWFIFPRKAKLKLCFKLYLGHLSKLVGIILPLENRFILINKKKMNFSHLIGHLEFVFWLIKKKSLIGAEEP